MKTAARSATIVGIVAGAAGVVASVLPPVLALEESLGLDVLYRLRGPQQPPSNVIIVAISEESAGELGLGDALRENVDLTGWPRRLHADLIAALDAEKVSVIAFDIHFRDQQDALNDNAFGAAIRASKRVILVENVDRDIDMPDANETGLPVQQILDSIVPPLATLKNAALATAPFPLPTVPFRTNQYWAFLPAANDAPTLPVMAFGVHAAEALETIGRRIGEAMPELDRELGSGTPAERMAIQRRALLQNPAIAAAILSDLNEGAAGSTEAGVRALVDLYTGPESLYVNYYGRPQTFTTVPIHQILNDGPDPSVRWQDSIVLVGFSERTQPNQDDAFVSIYSQRSGLNLSGVEIAATAIANLTEGSTLKPVSIGLQLTAVLCIGLLFGASFLFRSIAGPISALCVALVVYVLAVQLQFNLVGAWWPLVVPVVIQAPVALVLGLVLRYSNAEVRRDAVTRGASRYLPSDLVARIAEDPDAAARASELVNGICMVTDIEGFTAYSESMLPKRLEAALNDYYDQLFEIIDDNDGLVTDIVGDSMVAVWRNPDGDRDQEMKPLRAALAIRRRLTGSMASFPRTRVGLRAGEFVLGTVGAREHLEFRAVGDIVNSAARIQALNKPLGTVVLIARDALPARDLYYREIGTFQLAGMQNPLEIIEPIEIAATPDARVLALVDSFRLALVDFNQGRLDHALDAFETVLNEFDDDGPTRFYIEIIKGRLADVSASPQDSIIRLPG